MKKKNEDELLVMESSPAVSSRKAKSSISPERQERQSRKSPDRTGILRLDFGKPRRSSGGSVEFRGVSDKLGSQVEPASPQPSVDRLSVTFAGERSDCSESSVKVNIFDPGSPPSQIQLHDMEKVHFTGEKTVTDNEDEDDYSASVSVILQRKESVRRMSKKHKKRRPSSPFSPDGLQIGDQESRRRSSVFTTSSGETVVSVEDGTTQEQIFENIKLHKEVLSNVKQQPWDMRRKIKLVQQAKSYVKVHEGELQERLAMSKSTKDILARFNIYLLRKLQYLRRELANTMTLLIPWELRIKEIESHFGSAVASYFTFLRWMFWVNFVICIVLVAFVAIPEVLLSDPHEPGERKVMLPEEKDTATQLMTLWNFEGILKYSPFFYGYYTNKTTHVYKLPFAYFITGLAVYAYSFVATLRRMAENSRMSKLSEKDDECAFTWKLFTGWDYMIGNAETAHNRVASIVLGFKEALLEETEKNRVEQNWKVIAARVFVNLMFLALIVFSALIVFFVVERSTQPGAEDGWWRKNEISVALALITTIFPMFFELIGLLERYHPRKSLRLQLARIMVLNLLNLYTLIFSLFWKVSEMTIKQEVLRQNITSRVTSAVTDSPISVTTPIMSTIKDTDPCLELINICTTTITSIPVENITTALANMTSTVFPVFENTTWSSTSPDDEYEEYNETETYYETTIVTDTTEPDNLFDDYKTRKARTILFGIVLTPFYKAGQNISESLMNLARSRSTSPIPFETTTDDWPNWMNTTRDWSNLLNITRDWSTSTSFDSNLTLDWLNDKINESCFVTRCSVIGTTDMNPVGDVGVTGASVRSTDAPVKREREISSKDYDIETSRELRKLCWETMFGQELVKVTLMDLVSTTGFTLLIDFFRALFVRFMNNCWCWDLEKKFPQYGDFKIAENILHLVNNQGMVWMGMFFAPGIPLVNLLKLVVLMYLRSWAVLTCNVPHEVVFRASRSNNFYLALLLTMLFLCVLPVGYAIVWIEPSWHCGPFSNNKRIYHLFTKRLLKGLPASLQKALDYIASPGIIIPLLLLLVLIIYYLTSLTNSLREANNDLKIQLRRERTEERRKMFQIANKRARSGSGDSETPFGKWKKILPDLSPKITSDVESGDVKQGGQTQKPSANVKTFEPHKKEVLKRFMKKALQKHSNTSDDDSNPMADEVAETTKVKIQKETKETKNKKKKEREKSPPSGTSTHRNSVASDWSENIPVIKISKTESQENILDKKEKVKRPKDEKKEQAPEVKKGEKVPRKEEDVKSKLTEKKVEKKNEEIAEDKVTGKELKSEIEEQRNEKGNKDEEKQEGEEERKEETELKEVQNETAEVKDQ